MKSNDQAVLKFVKSKALSTQYPTFKMETTEGNILSTLQFVEKLLPDQVLMVCERSETPRVQYVSQNCKKVFGYEASVVQKMPLPEFLSLIHPGDIQNVHQCFGFMNSSEPYDPLLYRFEMSYRIKNKNGEYMHMRNEKMVVSTADGKYIYLASFKDVTSEEKFHGVKLNIYQRIQGEYKKIHTYNPRQGSSTFTPRQKDIVNLIRKGFSNQEIAQQLNVSIHTVKNHKNLLFKKANVKSSIELASITNELGAG